MIIDCVLTACNLNPMYTGFIPLFIKAWTKLCPSIDIKIILIHNKIPHFLQKYKQHIICFPPINGISTKFISQYIRLLYPAILDYSNGILITDMDCLPMNSKYYVVNIKNINNDKFVCYRRSSRTGKNQLPIVHNIAIPLVWKEIFNINSREDIITRLKEVYSKINYNYEHGKKGWSTDQLDLYKYVIRWNKNTKRFVCLGNNKPICFRRLCRSHKFRLNPNIKNKIKNGYYCDYHAYRPYAKYKKINDRIVQLLPTSKLKNICKVKK